MFPPAIPYDAYLTGEDVSFDVPYTWTGVATYAGGASARVSGTGIYKGDVTGYLHAIIYCANAPPGAPACPSIPISDTPLSAMAEPSTAMILPIALLGAVVARRWQPNAGTPGDEFVRAFPQAGMISGRSFGNWAITAGSRLKVAATISGGVCASQSDSETSS